MRFLGQIFVPMMLVVGVFLLLVGFFAEQREALATAGAVMLGSVLIAMPGGESRKSDDGGR